MNFAILASTNASDFPAIFSAFQSGKILGKIVCGVVNKENCGAQEKLEKENIPTFFVSHKSKTREDFDKEVHKILQNHKVDYVVCVGYMRILSSWFVQQWPNKIINIHPALLPKFPGAHAITDALEARVTETGATVHFIDEGVDTGPILMQKSCTVEKNETLESLKKKIQKIEQEIYPLVLEKISKNILNF